MRQLYSEKISKLFVSVLKLVALLILGLVASSANAQNNGFVFRNPVLHAGTAGANGAIYRFPAVAPGLDALVQIKDRSSSMVKLVNIDLSNTGWDKAFQPQVTYSNNTTPNGRTDWWMEFEMTVVKAGTTTPVIVKNLDLTALDIDGNGSRINEWVSLYNLKTYTIERRTSLKILDVLETIIGMLTNTGKTFEGPKDNYTNIDTSATSVMATTKYENRSSFRMRTGATSNGASSAADRMYSFWFKSFQYDAPVEGTLPVKLSAFTAKKSDNKVVLNWTTEQEKNVSHFVVERSTNGIDYKEAGLVFTEGNYNTRREYSFTDDLKTVSAAIVYYRLKMVDVDTRYDQSMVRIIRMAEEKGNTATVLAYPNPVVNELRITMPLGWQDKAVTIDVFNTNGQVIKHLSRSSVGQTETMNMSDLAVGAYVVKVSNGTTASIHRIVKSK